MFESIVAGLATAVLAATAVEGANPLPGAIMNKVSISDVQAMMTEMELSSAVVTVPGGGKVLLLTTPGGAKFGFSFLGCDDQANSVSCANTIVTAGIAAGAVTLDTINKFNGGSVVTTAIMIPEENIIIFGRNIVVLGGHARELFKGTVYLFLRDIQNFVDSSEASAKTVSAQKGESVQVGRDAVIAGKKDYSLEVTTAIDNVRGVTFAIEALGLF